MGDAAVIYLEDIKKTKKHKTSGKQNGSGIFSGIVYQSSFGPVWRIEDCTQIGGNFGAHVNAGHVVARILLQMELAMLPRHTGKARFTCSFQVGMAVADDQ